MLESRKSRRAHWWLTILTAVATISATYVLAAQAAVQVSPTASPSWRVNGKVSATVVSGDTLVVGGSFTRATSPDGTTAPRANLAAFSMSTGALLTGWRADTNGTVLALTVTGGRVFVGGSFTSVAGQTRQHLARVSLADGSLAAPSWQLDGDVMSLDSSADTVYAGGSFLTADGLDQFRAMKLDAASGVIDRSFAPRTNGPVQAMRLAPDGARLFVGGSFTWLNGQARRGLGVLDTATGAPTPVVFPYSVSPTLSLAINETGSRVYAGSANVNNVLTAYDASSGKLLWQHVADGDIQAADYYDGTVYFGFHDGDGGDTSVRLLAADASTGAIDSSFRPTFDAFYGVFAIDAGPFGVAAGGVFTNVSGVPAQGFVRFTLPTGSATTTLLPSGSTWRYRDNGQVASGWKSETFDDSSWARGPAQLGYGDGDERTVVGSGPNGAHYPTTWFRTTFDGGSTAPRSLVLSLMADDGAVVYLNGVEVARDNMPTGTVTADTWALTARAGAEESAFRDVPVADGIARAGTNVLAVEVHQESGWSSDISFDASLRGSTVLSSPSPSSSTSPTSSPTSPSSSPTSPTSSPTSPTSSPTSPSSSPTATPGTTYFRAGTAWRYWDKGTRPAGWSEASFADGSWASGNAQLGYGDGDEVTTVASGGPAVYLTTYFRKTFTVDALPAADPVLSMLVDDGAVVYVNGREVARDNMPSGTVSNTTEASTYRAGTGEDVFRDFTVPRSALVTGTNVIAVEVHQESTSSSDVSFDASLRVPAVSSPRSTSSPTASSSPTSPSSSPTSPTSSPTSPTSSPTSPSSSPTATPGTTYFRAGTAWRYWDKGTRPAGWSEASFADGSWASGNAQLGYGDGDEVTTVASGGPTVYLTTYFRKTFTVDALPAADPVLSMLVDDGAVVYVNGREVARDNMPSGTVSNTTEASTYRAGTGEDVFRDFTVPRSALVTGTNVIAVEVHQESTSSSDVSFDAGLRIP